jgi:hypothetical protein
VTTASSTWKAFERRIAALFGAVRAPLSGINGGVTGSDSLHSRLFLEAKLRNHHTVYTLWKKTQIAARKERKTPVLALQEKGHPGALLVIHTDDLDAFVVERMVAKPDLFFAAQQRIMDSNGE